MKIQRVGFVYRRLSVDGAQLRHAKVVVHSSFPQSFLQQ